MKGATNSNFRDEFEIAHIKDSVFGTTSFLNEIKHFV